MKRNSQNFLAILTVTDPFLRHYSSVLYSQNYSVLSIENFAAAVCQQNICTNLKLIMLGYEQTALEAQVVHWISVFGLHFVRKSEQVKIVLRTSKIERISDFLLRIKNGYP